MRTPCSLPAGATERLVGLLKEAQTKSLYQRVQCLWLRAALGLSATEIARALGWQASSVRPLHAQYLRHGEVVLQGKPHLPPPSEFHVNKSCLCLITERS